jgi:hypothetical protein
MAITQIEYFGVDGIGHTLANLAGISFNNQVKVP